MKILFKSIFRLDLEGNNILFREIPPDFNDFLINLISSISHNESTRYYKARTQMTEVIATIRDAIQNIKKTHPDTDAKIRFAFEGIARRLLKAEIEKQEQISRLNKKIQKGSLVQAIIYDEENEDLEFLIAKVEYSAYVDDDDFKRRIGFESEDIKIWKSCVFDCIDNDEEVIIDNARIYLNTGAKYWSENFLELDEMRNDEYNTDIAFKSIETILKKSVKPKSANDYTILRNTFIGYLNREQHIDYGTMIEDVISNYEPSEEFNKDDISKVKNKLLKLPDEKKFDKQFTSFPKAIKARIKKIYPVTQEIELIIKEHIENIDEMIKSIEDPDGKRYIKIRTNNIDTYKAFDF